MARTVRARNYGAGGRDRQVAVDPVPLFRFSALTYNAHRIHYDREYARAEGYPGLVVHGPLQALLMAELARSRVRPGPSTRTGWSRRYIEDQGLIVSAAPDGSRGPGVVPRHHGPRYRHRPDQLALLR